MGTLRSGIFRSFGGKGCTTDRSWSVKNLRNTRTATFFHSHLNPLSLSWRNRRWWATINNSLTCTQNRSTHRPSSREKPFASSFTTRTYADGHYLSLCTQRHWPRSSRYSQKVPVLDVSFGADGSPLAVGATLCAGIT